MSQFLISAPLQGLTDYRFRNSFDKHFGGIDKFIAPYIKLELLKKNKVSVYNDLLPSNNFVENLVPQALINNIEDYKLVEGFVKDFGYKEININLGCPFPMLTNKCLGAGLLAYPERIDSLLSDIFEFTEINISVKMRLAYETNSDITVIIPILNKYPIKEIIIHARNAKQMYKGSTDVEMFRLCNDLTSHKLVYNGNIFNHKSFTDINNKLNDTDTLCLGRAVIADPFLPQLIKSNNNKYPSDAITTFKAFHEDLLNQFLNTLSGESHVLSKMLNYWEYFSLSFSSSHKVLKKFKKAKKLESYQAAVQEVLNYHTYQGIQANSF